MPAARGVEGPRYYQRPTGPDLVGGLGQERGVRRRSAGYGAGGGLNGVADPIRWGDPGLYPGANTMDPTLTRGLSGLDLLGSAAILTTDQGVEAVSGHFRNVLGTQIRVDFLTTPTWNTSPVIVDPLEGDPRLPQGETAESMTRRGVEIVRETLEEAGSGATMLLSVRPTGNTVDGSGTLSPIEIKRMLKEQFTWLLEAAGPIPSVLTLETEPTLRGAKAFAQVAEEFERPYIVTLRPTDQGRMPDRTPYDRVVGEIAGQYFVGGGFNCQTIFAIETAMDLAGAQGAKPLTMIAAPNGADGYNENIGGTATQADQIRADNIDGLARLRKKHGTIFIAGCCNSTANDVRSWQESLEGVTPSETVGAARQAERLVFRGVGIR